MSSPTVARLEAMLASIVIALTLLAAVAGGPALAATRTGHPRAACHAVQTRRSRSRSHSRARSRSRTRRCPRARRVARGAIQATAAAAQPATGGAAGSGSHAPAGLTTAGPAPNGHTTGAGHAAIANPFGQAMFGLASGGDLQNEPSAQLSLDLNADRSLGAKWLRVDINWASIQAAGPASGNWTNTDALVRGARARGMHVLGVIVYTPSWDRPAGTGPTYEPTPDAYGAFAGAAATHLSALGVHAYEIWNEENLQDSWTPAPSPAAYTAILEAAYPAIHAADPTATVVTGGLSPAVSDGTDVAPTDFLTAMYADGAHGSFDAVGAHPYCWPANPGDPETWSAWYQMYGTPTSLRSVMVANGDGDKQIWGTEFGAPTGGPAGSYLSEVQQAETITDAFQLWSTYRWAGPLFVFQDRDQGTDPSSYMNFFGLERFDGSPKPAFRAYQAAVAQF